MNLSAIQFQEINCRQFKEFELSKELSAIQLENIKLSAIQIIVEGFLGNSISKNELPRNCRQFNLHWFS